MGTKNNPGNYDCYANAEDDEPMFMLLARDKAAPETVKHWIAERLRLELNMEDDEQIVEARNCIGDMEGWRKVHRPDPIETINDFLLGSTGDRLTFLLPPANMTREQAVRAAAWLLAMSGGEIDEFTKVYEAVSNT